MKKTIISLCISCFITCLILTGMHYIYQKPDLNFSSSITIQAAKSADPSSKGSEVWITDIFVDGYSMDLADMPLKEEQYFLYDAIMLDGNSRNPSIDFTFSGNPESSIIIYFTSHDYSGTAIVKSSDTTEFLDLYSPVSDHLVYSVKPDLAASDIFDLQEYFTVFIICFCLLFFFIYFPKDRFLHVHIFVSSYLLIGLLFILVSADLRKISFLLMHLFLAAVFSGFVGYVFIPLYRNIGKVIDHKYYLIIMVIFSICTSYILLYYSDLNYQLLRAKTQTDNYPVSLSLHSSTSDGESSGEIWINSAVIDRKNISLNELLYNSDNWEITEDDRLFSNTVPNYVSFPSFSTLPLSVNFTFHPYSGEVIANLNSHSKTLQLNDPDTSWNFIDFKHLFFNEITADINRILPSSNYLLWMYNTVLSLIICPFIFCILSGLYICIKNYHRLSFPFILILTILSIYDLYKITTDTLISDYEVKFYNYIAPNQSASNHTIKIIYLSTSGTAVNPGYELDSFETGNWTIDYKNSISFINTGDNAAAPLIYHIHNQNILFSKSSLDRIFENMVLCVEKSPQGGVLMVEFNGKKQLIDCYSPYTTSEFLNLDCFYLNSHFDPSPGILILLVFILIYYTWRNKENYLRFVHEETVFQKIFRMSIAVLFTLALYGQDLLSGEQKNANASIARLSILLMILIGTVCLLPSVIMLIKKFHPCINGKNAAMKILVHRKLKIFFTFISFQMLWYLILLPGGVNQDVAAQWEQTQGLAFYNDWHPLFHTLLIKFFTSFDNNIYIYFCFQIVFVTLVLTLAAIFLIEKGIKEHIVAVAFIIFLSLPNNEIITEATKDVIGTYSYIWITLLTAKLLLDGPDSFWSHRSNQIQAFIALFFTMNIRHSQQSVGIIFLFIILIQMIRFRKKYRTTIIFIIGFLFFQSLSMNGIRSYTDYHNYTKGLKYVTPIADLAGLAVNDLEIDKNTKELTESAMSIDEWKTYYNPYYPSTALIDNNVDYGNIFAELSLRDVLSLYMRNFMKYPLQMVRTRLLGSHIIWGITQGTDGLAKNQHTYLELRPNPFGLERSNTILKKIGENYITSYHFYNLVDIFIWRSGVHIMILLIYLYIICRYSEKEYCLILLPCIVFTALLFIALPAPNYRYIYYLPVTSFFMTLLLPVLISKRKVN